ncbi:MAG TPA: hypothetical protein VFB80_16720 [Pirellulaceae bacterium]|jgi:hypothetical protein|nr:hypothetical protein [Pirellulaceae bacterium]
MSEIPEIPAERREQAAMLIRLYCKRPFRDHGRRRTDGPYKGWYQHDWGHVVQRIYRLFFDQQLDIPSATIASKAVRSEFPSRNDWEKRVGTAQAQIRMLALIEEGLAPFAPVKTPVA